MLSVEIRGNPWKPVGLHSPYNFGVIFEKKKPKMAHIISVEIRGNPWKSVETRGASIWTHFIKIYKNLTILHVYCPFSSIFAVFHQILLNSMIFIDFHCFLLNFNDFALFLLILHDFQ